MTPTTADLPQEMIDLIFSFVPSIGLHVSKKFDKVSLNLDYYSTAKHFFLGCRRSREAMLAKPRSIQCISDDEFDNDEAFDFVSKKKYTKLYCDCPCDIMWGILIKELDCPAFMLSILKDTNIITKDDVLAYEASSMNYGIVPDSIMQELLDNPTFMHELLELDMKLATKIYTRDQVFPTYNDILRDQFNSIGSIIDDETIIDMMDHMTEYNHTFIDIFDGPHVLSIDIVKKIASSLPDMERIMKEPQNDLERLLRGFMNCSQ